MTKIVLDVLGADHSPLEPIMGAVKAVKNISDLTVVLVGDSEQIVKILNNQKADLTRFEIVDAKEAILNTDVPTTAIKTKVNSSMVKAFEALKANDDVAAIVSGGSTGALLTGAFLKLGRIKGVSRPALCPILPTVGGPNNIVAITDSGANVDCKPLNLVHFAIMGNAFLKLVYGIDNPRVALLNIGAEEKKGNELALECYKEFSELKNINFVGNMEGRDLLSGNVDLVVADGFSGNVLLKSTEGAILNLLKLLKTEIKSSVVSSIGALFMKKTFKKLKDNLDYNKKAGAVLLGCKKLVVKVHGSAKSESFYKSIELAVDMAKADLCNKIDQEINGEN